MVVKPELDSDRRNQGRSCIRHADRQDAPERVGSPERLTTNPEGSVRPASAGLDHVVALLDRFALVPTPVSALNLPERKPIEYGTAFSTRSAIERE
jgi:hypothetical protein